MIENKPAWATVTVPGDGAIPQQQRPEMLCSRCYKDAAHVTLRAF